MTIVFSLTKAIVDLNMEREKKGQQQHWLVAAAVAEVVTIVTAVLL